MKADLSVNDIAHSARLPPLGPALPLASENHPPRRPPSALRIRIAALEHDAAVQRAMTDLLAGIRRHYRFART